MSGPRGRDLTKLTAPPGNGPAEPGPEVIAGAQRGDVDAFEQIYHAYVGRVHALCRRLSGDAERAEDLTQDVFVRAWRRLGSFQGRSRFYTWLYRLAVNLATDNLRAARRRGEVEMLLDPTDVEQPLAHLHVAPTPPENRIALEAAIARLPEGARAVFVLHDVEGFQHQEIAAFLEIATGTSKAQLHRARRLLRQMLSEGTSKPGTERPDSSQEN